MGRMQSIQTVKKTYSQFLRSVRQPSRRSLTSGAKKRHHSKHVHPVTLAEHLQERVGTLLHFMPKLHLPHLACRGTFRGGKEDDARLSRLQQRHHFCRMWLLFTLLSLSHIQRERRLLPNCLESENTIKSRLRCLLPPPSRHLFCRK